MPPFHAKTDARSHHLVIVSYHANAKPERSPGVRVAALVTWILSAAAGSYLLAGWLAGAGLRGQATKVTRFPVALVLGHPLLGLAGLAVWVAFLVTGRIAYAWGAFGVLVVVTLLGFLMLTRWLVGGGGRHARGAEIEFPVVAVVAHGVVAVTTFVLVYLCATVIHLG